MSRDDLPDGAVELATFLLGKIVVRTIGNETLAGRVAETEAYLSDDPASHSFIGETARNRSMFLEKGHAYIYRIYGMWQCFNMSSGSGGAVLVRAVEPLLGLSKMNKLRGFPKVRDLTRGPGRLCQAMAIDGSMDGTDLCRPGAIFVGEDGYAPSLIATTPRIGITKASEALLRFYDVGSQFVSGTAAQNNPVQRVQLQRR